MLVVYLTKERIHEHMLGIFNGREFIMGRFSQGFRIGVAIRVIDAGEFLIFLFDGGVARLGEGVRGGRRGRWGECDDLLGNRLRGSDRVFYCDQ